MDNQEINLEVIRILQQITYVMQTKYQEDCLVPGELSSKLSQLAKQITQQEASHASQQ